MLEIEIDGKVIQVPDGSTVMDAVNRLGAYVPHFCYHKKLSIAANCRMCLVEVERAPKPLPACATPVTNGMKVKTHSERAASAQKGVMEFLLINHPLDCPICDQGGECQLQDLAVGYGASGSRYQEEKRVVLNKNLGPLIATDMTRCIHCTRCVRFGQEIAGVMELGVANRGETSEIMSFVGTTVDSELSGNMIDLCPVGALTSKPFRFSARAWEMARRRSVSPHDAVGSNLVLQVKQDVIKRVLPLENESVNECWISDRDRFSYEGVHSDDRLLSPMVKRDGKWYEADWQQALEAAGSAIKQAVAVYGPQSIGILISPHATLEEMSLAAKLGRELGTANVDFRLRQTDFSVDAVRRGVPWLGTPIAELAENDVVLVLGSVLRKDHPLIAQRLRQAAKRGTRVALVGWTSDDPRIQTSFNAAVAPSSLRSVLSDVAEKLASGAAPDGCNVTDLVSGELLRAGKKLILLGAGIVSHPEFGELWRLAQCIADRTGAVLGFLAEAANSVGGYIAGADRARGLGAHGMFDAAIKVWITVGVEPACDCADGLKAIAALQGSEAVISLTAFRSAADTTATVMLPMGTFAETSGTFVNMEGRAQSFQGAIKPIGESRAGWKILRVLGDGLGLNGFEYASSEAIRDEVLPKGETALSNRIDAGESPAQAATPFGGQVGLERIASVPLYATDPLVRRAPSLQATRDARSLRARLSARTAAEYGLAERVRLMRDGGKPVVLDVELDDAIPAGCVAVPTALPQTVELGPMHGRMMVERD